MNIELIELAKHGKTEELESVFKRYQINRESYTWFLWDSINLFYTPSDGMNVFKCAILNGLC